MLIGENAQVKPVEGETVEASEIVPANPSRADTVTVEVPDDPANADKVVGLAASL